MSCNGTIVEVEAPAAEPVTVEECVLHSKMVNVTAASDQEAYVEELIAVARGVVEIETWRALITQSLKYVLDAFPSSRVIKLPRAPIQEVESVTYIDEAGDEVELDAALWTFHGELEPHTIELVESASWPTTSRNGSAVAVTFTAGFGDDGGDVPPQYKLAIKMLVGHWFENREPLQTLQTLQEIPKTVDYLFKMNKLYGV